jgi:hypothetical protein
MEKRKPRWRMDCSPSAVQLCDIIKSKKKIMTIRLSWLTILALSAGSSAHAVLVTPAGVTDSSGIILQSVSVFPTAGTGVFGDVFLRVQNNGTETGFNSDVQNNNTIPPINFTHDLLLSSLQATTAPGGTGSYYQISLDINQTQNPNSPLLQLTNLQVYTHNTDNATSVAQLGAADLTLVADYELPDINAGSGDGDVQIFIPTASLSAGTFFTLNVTFANATAGFEEFTARSGTTPPTGTPGVPDNGLTVAMLGASLAALGLIRRGVKTS